MHDGKLHVSFFFFLHIHLLLNRQSVIRNEKAIIKDHMRRFVPSSSLISDENHVKDDP